MLASIPCTETGNRQSLTPTRRPQPCFDPTCTYSNTNSGDVPDPRRAPNPTSFYGRFTADFTGQRFRAQRRGVGCSSKEPRSLIARPGGIPGV